MTPDTLHADATPALGREIRKSLHASFPTVKFSLTRDRGHGYLTLTWTDGPTRELVSEVTAPFRARLASIRAMIIHQRRYSPDADARAAAEVAAHPGRWSSLQDDDLDDATYFEKMRFLADTDLTEVLT